MAGMGKRPVPEAKSLPGPIRVLRLALPYKLQVLH